MNARSADAGPSSTRCVELIVGVRSVAQRAHDGLPVAVVGGRALIGRALAGRRLAAVILGGLHCRSCCVRGWGLVEVSECREANGQERRTEKLN